MHWNQAADFLLLVVITAALLETSCCGRLSDDRCSKQCHKLRSECGENIHLSVSSSTWMSLLKRCMEKELSCREGCHYGDKKREDHTCQQQCDGEYKLCQTHTSNEEQSKICRVDRYECRSRCIEDYRLKIQGMVQLQDPMVSKGKLDGEKILPENEPSEKQLETEKTDDTQQAHEREFHKDENEVRSSGSSDCVSNCTREQSLCHQLSKMEFFCTLLLEACVRGCGALTRPNEA